MNEVITEKNYKIENLWFGKSLILYFFRVVLISLYFGRGVMEYVVKNNKPHDIGIPWIGWYYFTLAVIYFFPFDLITAYLQRANYHYALDTKFLTVKQGIFSKKERHIPYGVIQNIFVKQDLYDRLFGLASLSVENSSQGAGGLNAGNNSGNADVIGSSGNKVSIPGLSKQNAEILKVKILQKMKENPIEDSQSGL